MDGEEKYGPLFGARLGERSRWNPEGLDWFKPNKPSFCPKGRLHHRVIGETLGIGATETSSSFFLVFFVLFMFSRGLQNSKLFATILWMVKILHRF